MKLSAQVIKKIANYGRKLPPVLRLKWNQVSQNYQKANDNSPTNVVLFFLPEMAVGLYSSMLAGIAGAIQSEGYAPLFFGCNGFLNGCLLQDQLAPHSRFFGNAIVCAKCQIEGAGTAERSNLKFLDCRRSNRRSISFAGSSLAERLEYSYKGIPVGRLAYYDLSIKFKRDRSRLELNDREVLYYDGAISDGMGIVDFLEDRKRALSIIGVISIDEYCLANIVREWARLKNVSAYRAGFSYHFNADPQFVTLSSSKTRAAEKFSRLSRWDLWRQVPLPGPIVDEISSDLIFRMSGSGGHIFSTNFTGKIDGLMEKYRLVHGVRTLVAFTSANDEIDAITELSNALGDNFAVQDAFDSQLKWLEFIVNYARANPVQLIIKMHPRLSGSHRDSGSAEDIQAFRNLANTAPANVVFLWPEDGVSAYDILQIADLCLTSWGTMGLEAAKMGVPVLSGMTKITFATPGLALFSKAETEEEFHSLMGKSATDIGISDLAEAFRWHHLMHISGAIILDGERKLDLYGSDFSCSFPDVLRGADVEERKRVFLTERMEERRDVVTQEEYQAIVAGVNKLLAYFERGFNNSASASTSKLVARLQTLCPQRVGG